MKKVLYHLFLGLCLCHSALYGQWTVPPCPLPGTGPENAPLIDCCLDNYSYSTFYIPNPLPINSFCGTVENSQWLAFRANFTGITLSITVDNCLGSQPPGGGGVQVQIFGIGDYCSIYDLYPVGNCFNPGAPIAGSVTATGLIPGQVYYIMIDGWSGDACDYTISEIDTVDPLTNADITPVLTGPTNVVSGQTATYTLEFPGLDLHNPCENEDQDPTFCGPGCFEWEPIAIEWTGPPGSVVTPIPNSFSADITFGIISGEVCIHITTFCGTTSYCLWVDVENICAYAGEDAEICGFTYQLTGANPLPGEWTFLENMSDGQIAFSGDPFEPTVTVTNCGDYYFQFYSFLCNDEDLIKISFEDPSYTSTQIDMDIDLDYVDLECHEGGEAEPCMNTVSIPGLSPPSVEWQFCINGDCQAFVFENEFTDQNDWWANEILITPDTINGNGYNSCSSFGQDEVLDNFFDLVHDLTTSALNSLGCTTPPKCFPPPEISYYYDTVTVQLPKREGGQWHGIFPTGIISLLDTTSFIYDNKDLILILQPGATYYGPGDLDLQLFEITTFGDTIYSSIQVDFQLQWIEEWSYVEVTRIDTLAIVDDPFNCPSDILSSPTIVIPYIPDFPCGQIDVSFPPYDCQMCPVDVTAIVNPPYAVLDCCNPCVTLFGSGFSSAGNVSVHWANGSGGSTTTVCGGGAYTVIVTALPSGCSTEQTVYVDEDFDVPTVSIIPPDQINCLQPCVQLEAVVNGNSFNHVYFWQGPNGFTSYELSPMVCQPGTYSLLVTNLNNCCETQESVDVIEFNDPEIFNIQTSICAGDCYDLDGQIYCDSGLYTQNGVDADGCPTITILDLEVLNNSQSDLLFILCPEEDFDFHGTIYNILNPNGTTILQNYVGCDSLVNVQLEFFDPQHQIINADICEGTCYEVNGILYCQAGIYSQNITDANACDALIEINITEYPVQSSNLEIDLCESESIEINGTVYSVNNPSGLEIFPDIHGCDSLVTVIVNNTPIEYDNISATICENDCYELNGEIYCDSGTYMQILQGFNGCDSILELSLSFYPVQTTDHIVDLCEGEFIEINGTIYNQLNPLGIEFFQDFHGCDSLVAVLVNFLPPENDFLEVKICQGDCFEWNGVVYCDPGFYTQIFQGSNGCEGLLEIEVINHSAQISDWTIDLCAGDSILMNNTWYGWNNQSGQEIFVDLNGCDSLVNINVNLHIPEPLEYYEILCEGNCFEYEGDLLCDEGQYYYMGLDSMGCEVDVVIDLQILPAPQSDYSEILCASEEIIINGTTYNQQNPSGQEFFQTFQGCDSIVNINLDFIEISVDINTPEILNCANPTTLLAANYSTNGMIEWMQWTSMDGNIISDAFLPEILVDALGTYQIEIATDNGCANFDLILVAEDFAAPALEVISETILDCVSGTATLFCQTGELEYAWTGPGIDATNVSKQNPEVSTAGTYTLLATNPENGCTSTASVEVIEIPEIDFEVPGIKPICGIQEILLEPIIFSSIDDLVFEWNTGSNEPSIIVNALGDYFVLISNECETVNLKFVVESNYFALEEKIYVPNAFSPNGDLINDVFQVYPAVDLQQFELLVFDRWGNIVFESDDPNRGWNGHAGTSLNDKMNNGVYVWMLYAEGMDCDNHLQRVQLKGDLVLLR